MTSSEVSNPGRARPPFQAPPTGPVGIAAREFFAAEVVDDSDVVGGVPASPLRPFIDEPYVYGGKPVAARPSAAWLATGVAAVAGLIILVSGRSDVADKTAELAKAKADLATLTTASAEQSSKIDALEKLKAATLATQSVRDQDALSAAKRGDDLRAALAASVADDVKRGDIKVAADGARVKVELRDRFLFDDSGVTLTDEGRAALVKLAAPLRKSDGAGAIEIVGHSDPRRVSAKAKPQDALVDGAWGLAAARATVVARALEDDGKLAGKRLAAVGKGASTPIASNANAKGRSQNRRVEIVVTP